jgi:hypothetical protein
MIDTHDDLTWQSLRRLRVLEPDAARADRLRLRCRAAMVEQQHRRDRQTAPRHERTSVLESALACGLSVGYLSAMVVDLLRLYLRR